jgi:predicted lipoprotein
MEELNNENQSKLYKIAHDNSRTPQTPKEYRYQKAMDDLNDMMIRVKVHLYDREDLKPLKEMYEKPTVEELDMFTVNIMSVLEEINEKQIKH